MTRSRVALVGLGGIVGLAVLLGSLVLVRELPATNQGPLPDFALQKAIYEPAVGVHYTFSGADALLLKPEDLGRGWYFGNDPAAKRMTAPTRTKETAGLTPSQRRLVKATRVPGRLWKPETCVMEAVTRKFTTTAAAAELDNLVRLIDGKGLRQRVVAGVLVMVRDTPQMRSAVFRRGVDVFNLNVCLHLATSDFSPAAADALVEAAVRRSAS